jgi:hypothetical protein
MGAAHWRERDFLDDSIFEIFNKPEMILKTELNILTLRKVKIIP